mmetsp:Transcript_3769/g.9424  ORF Transcript_3769/g.9424 Transcript_3769/m.9424 type:complete len:82 (-) Transcript_3769:1141-1386(-)
MHHTTPHHTTPRAREGIGRCALHATKMCTAASHQHQHQQRSLKKGLHWTDEKRRGVYTRTMDAWHEGYDNTHTHTHEECDR